MSRRGRSSQGQQTRYPEGVKPADYEVEVPPQRDESPSPAMEEAAAKTRETSKRICWNCRQPGHGFRDCISGTRSIFCFRCGKPDTYSPQCVNCPGNTWANAMKPGQTRSEPRPDQKP
ncbi:hypothetical protein KR215_002499 [Drosophila sulfurigaster]|nr:hypothetical protein KR215_002499 [Drosophila sulfurigaster]